MYTVSTLSPYEYIAGEHGYQCRYEATSRVRRQIQDTLTADMDHLAELRSAVCSEGANREGGGR